MARIGRAQPIRPHILNTLSEILLMFRAADGSATTAVSNTAMNRKSKLQQRRYKGDI